MTLSVSWDGGVTWLKKINIYKSHSAYSDLVELDNGDIFVFYEAGEQGAYETISYKIISKDQVQ
jgi:sialidase-1